MTPKVDRLLGALLVLGAAGVSLSLLLSFFEAVAPVLDFMLKLVSIFGATVEGPFLIDYHAPPYNDELFGASVAVSALSGAGLIWLNSAGHRAQAAAQKLSEAPGRAFPDGPPTELPGRTRSAHWPYEFLEAPGEQRQGGEEG